MCRWPRRNSPPPRAGLGRPAGSAWWRAREEITAPQVGRFPPAHAHHAGRARHLPCPPTLEAAKGIARAQHPRHRTGPAPGRLPPRSGVARAKTTLYPLGQGLGLGPISTTTATPPPRWGLTSRGRFYPGGALNLRDPQVGGRRRDAVAFRASGRTVLAVEQNVGKWPGRTSPSPSPASRRTNRQVEAGRTALRGGCARSFAFGARTTLGTCSEQATATARRPNRPRQHRKRPGFRDLTPCSNRWGAGSPSSVWASRCPLFDPDGVLQHRGKSAPHRSS